MTGPTANTRHIHSVPTGDRVFKVRRIADGKFRQTFSPTERNTDEDRWGHGIDRIYLTKAEAGGIASKESKHSPCEVVTFRLVEETDDARLEHVRRTGLIRDAKDLEVWICQPPFKHDQEVSDQSLRALLDAAASFD